LLFFFLEDLLSLPRLKLLLRVPFSIFISSPPSGVSMSENSSPVSPSEETSSISSSLASRSSLGLSEVCSCKRIEKKHYAKETQI